MQLVLDTKGITLDVKHNAFFVSTEKISKRISPKKVTSIAVTENCMISSRAVILSIENEIPILFFNRIGKIKARLWSPYFQSLATLRRLQVEFAKDTAATKWIINLLRIKTEQQVINLKYLANRQPKFAEALHSKIYKIKAIDKRFDQHEDKDLATCRNNLMGIEGSIAYLYWQGVSEALPADWQFEKRSRRPALDNFNAAINYLYGMTYTIVEGAIFAAGLDPQLGLLHVDDYRKPTLSFDLIEPFRPWVDKFLIQSCLEGELQASFFTKNQHGLHLNKHGKAFLIPTYNDFLKQVRLFQNRQSSNKNHIYHVAGQLARKIRTLDDSDRNWE